MYCKIKGKNINYYQSPTTHIHNYYKLISHYLPGFHVCPQLAHLFTVLLLPKKPVSNEYPLCPAVIAVEPHLGHLGIFLSLITTSSFCTFLIFSLYLSVLYPQRVQWSILYEYSVLHCGQIVKSVLFLFEYVEYL